MKERGGAGKSPNHELNNQRNNHPNEQGGSNKESAANIPRPPLLTETLKKQIPALYSQENEKDPPVVCKFFDPVGSWTWYAIEGSQVDEDGYFDTDKAKVDFLFFGFVVGFEPELGYFSFQELETKSYRQKVVNQATSTLSEIHMDLKRGDRSRLEFRLEQVNSAFDLVVLVDEALKILGKYRAPRLTSSQAAPGYFISSWFLADCLSYLTSDPQQHERLHLVTGIKISPKQRTLERMVKVPLRVASEVGAMADQRELQKALIEMDRRGHTLYGLFHSHPGEGAHATRPSPTDFNTHERYEKAYPLVGAIFVKDGFVRFFSKKHPFTITIYGEGVITIDQAQHIYQIENPPRDLSLQAISGKQKWPGYSH